MSTYLLELNRRLAEGLGHMAAEQRARSTRYLEARQNEDGGWSGREGESDLYYTGFALRGLAVLGALSPEIGTRAARFLRGALTQRASVVDLFSLLYACLLVQATGGPEVLSDSPADWPDRVAALLETFRTKDGGYNKSAGSPSGSTYHTFLVALCYELLGRRVPDTAAVASFARGRRRDDGGFVEVSAMRRSGTNPTAAGIGVLQLACGADVPAVDVEPAVDFLARMPSMEGGLCANDRIPVADLLSTFTGCWTLSRLGALDRIDLVQARRYALSLELPDGGFRGGIWDEATDVEYTFYGLGTLALFANPAPVHAPTS
jgi:geranylgeranyl transferase type-2 subunit beta